MKYRTREKTDVDFSILTGLTLTSIDQEDGDLIFNSSDGRKFLMHHEQSCCESVDLEEIHGDLQDLIGSPILLAEKVTSEENPPGVKKEYQDCFTWTFFKISTIKGSVTLRWYGASNGYYSEDVNFDELKGK